MASLDSLSDSELRRKLKEYGYNAPPITQSTRKVLLKKLSNFMVESERNTSPKITRSNRQILSQISSGEESASEVEDGRNSSRNNRMPPPKSTVRRRISSKLNDSLPSTISSMSLPKFSTTSSSMTLNSQNSFSISPSPTKRRNRFTMLSSNVSSTNMDSGSDSEPFQSNFGRRLKMERNSLLRGTPLLSSTPTSVADVKEDDSYRAPLNGTYNYTSKLSFSPHHSSTLTESRLSSLGNSFIEEKTGSKQQFISTILQLVVLGFFIVLAILYTMSIRTRELGSLIDKSKATIPLCKNDLNMDGPCIHTENIEPSIWLFQELQPELMNRALKYRCEDQEKAKDPIMTEKDVVNWLSTLPEGKIEKHVLSHPQVIIQSLKTLVLSNPDWGVSVIGEGSPLSLVFSGSLSIQNPPLPLGCYVRRTVFGLAYAALIALALIVIALIAYQSIRWWLHRCELRRQAVCDLVQRALEILAAHQQESGGYMSISHIRDQILSPSERHSAASLWDEAVHFIETQESRVRSEMQTVAGETCVVWRWLPPPRRNKVWQGQAFETQAGAVNSLPISPTPCLKIRHMFDPELESGDEWPLRVQDAVLEKCEGIKILHLAVDKTNKEGCVYLYCLNEEEAGRAYRTLHGSWFDSKLVTVKYLRIERYLERFPDAASAKIPLKPSNGQRLSLAKP